MIYCVDHYPAKLPMRFGGAMRSSSFPWPDFLRRLALIAIPVALQNLLTITGSMVDTMMIASLGETSVGAVGLCAQFSSLMFSGYWGFVGGGMLFFAKYFGAGDEKGIKRSYGLTLCCMMSVGLLFGLTAILKPEAVMRLYTDKESIRTIGAAYLRIAGFSYPLSVLSMAMAALLRSTEQVRLPLFGAIAGVSANIFLNWVLIFGHLGMPAMGVRGAALATVFSGFINVSTIALLSRRARHPYLFAVREHFGWSRPFIREYFIKCWPILCNEVLIGVGNMGINVVLGRQSEQAIAATAVFRTLEGLVIGFFAGFSNASSVLVGTEVGAGHLETARQRAVRLVYLCMGFIGLICLLLVVLHTPILRAMSLTGESFRLAYGMLCIYGVVAVIRRANWVQNDTYRAAGDAAYGTLLEIVFMFAVVLPAVWITGMVLHTPFLLVFACCYVNEPVRFVLMQRHLFSGKWMKPVTPEGRAALQEMQADRNA